MSTTVMPPLRRNPKCSPDVYTPAGVGSASGVVSLHGVNGKQCLEFPLHEDCDQIIITSGVVHVHVCYVSAVYGKVV